MIYQKHYFRFLILDLKTITVFINYTVLSGRDVADTTFSVTADFNKAILVAGLLYVGINL